MVRAEMTMVRAEMTMVRAVVLLALGIVLSGCASITENLQRETARSIGGLNPDQVTVSNVKRGMTSCDNLVKWQKRLS